MALVTLSIHSPTALLCVISPVSCGSPSLRRFFRRSSAGSRANLSAAMFMLASRAKGAAHIFLFPPHFRGLNFVQLGNGSPECPDRLFSRKEGYAPIRIRADHYRIGLHGGSMN